MVLATLRSKSERFSRLTLANRRGGTSSTGVRQEMSERHAGSRDQIAAPEDTVRLVERNKQVRVSRNIFGEPEE